MHVHCWFLSLRTLFFLFFHRYCRLNPRSSLATACRCLCLPFSHSPFFFLGVRRDHFTRPSISLTLQFCICECGVCWQWAKASRTLVLVDSTNSIRWQKRTTFTCFSPTCSRCCPSMLICSLSVKQPSVTLYFSSQPCRLVVPYWAACPGSKNRTPTCSVMLNPNRKRHQFLSRRQRAWKNGKDDSIRRQTTLMVCN